MRIASTIGGITAALVLSGCLNMPTPTTQITGAYQSTIRYEQYDCDRLTIERDNLSRRQSTLVGAQEQRIRTSQTQAFWWGFGQGDGIEASELAQVRGELEAVTSTMDVKGCPR